MNLLLAMVERNLEDWWLSPPHSATQRSGLAASGWLMSGAGWRVAVLRARVSSLYLPLELELELEPEQLDAEAEMPALGCS